MKNEITSSVTTLKETLISLAIKISALLAFLVINFISYSAFSQEAAVKTTLAAQSIESSIPACHIAPEGLVENTWKSVRIQVGDAVVAGAETLSDLTKKLKQLAMEQKCLPIPVQCGFASEGLASGAWAKHRIMVQDVIAFGSNTTARLFEQLGELKKIGVCK